MLIRCDNILIRLVDKILIRFMNDRYMIDDSTMFSHLTSQVLPLVLRRRLAAACHDAQRRGQVGHLAFVQGEAAQLLLRQGANWVWLGNWGLSICLYMVIYGYIMLYIYIKIDIIYILYYIYTGIIYILVLYIYTGMCVSTSIYIYK